jgi:hypothetical protein
MNNINVTKQELDKLVKNEGIEVYSQRQFDAFVLSNKDLILKSQQDELNDIEKSEYNEITEEIGSFRRAEVYNKAENSQTIIEKSIVYIRPKQVEWSEELVKSESGEDEKKKTGTYTDTLLNRNLHRVGNVYGEIEKAEEEDLEKAKSGTYRPNKKNLKEGKAGAKYGSEKKEKNKDKIGQTIQFKDFSSGKTEVKTGKIESYSKDHDKFTVRLEDNTIKWVPNSQIEESKKKENTKE